MLWSVWSGFFLWSPFPFLFQLFGVVPCCHINVLQFFHLSGKVRVFFELFFISTKLSGGTANFTRWWVLFFLLFNTWFCHLKWSWWCACISESERIRLNHWILFSGWDEPLWIDMIFLKIRIHMCYQSLLFPNLVLYSVLLLSLCYPNELP